MRNRTNFLQLSVCPGVLSVWVSILQTCLLGSVNLHVGKWSDHLSQEFIDLLSSMDFVQHVMQPIHNRGHTLDLVISHAWPVHQCVLCCWLGCIWQLLCFLTSKVVCNRRPWCELWGNTIWPRKWLQIWLKFYTKVLQLFYLHPVILVFKILTANQSQASIQWLHL